MKTGSSLLVILSCLFLWCSVVESAEREQPPRDQIPPNVLDGMVVGISEGDHITVNSFGTEINVRLYGIAAPQVAKIDKFTGWTKVGQPYSQEAFRALSVKVLHQNVKVEIRRTIVYGNEKKQMALAVVYVDGRNVNLEMVAEGWAWAYRKLLTMGDLHPYLMAERRARARRAGLWDQPHPLPPWEFHPKIIMPKQHGISR